MHEFSRQKNNCCLIMVQQISAVIHKAWFGMFAFFAKRAISMCVHMCDSLAAVVINCCVIQDEFWNYRSEKMYICDFVDSHYHRIPNEGGVSASIAKPELTEGTHIDVMTNIVPIYYKLLLTILLSLYSSCFTITYTGYGRTE